MRRIALIIVLAAFTAACSSSIRSNVTRFHKLPAPMGESVFITSSDASKAGGLEFSQYAGLLVPQLQSLGYSVINDPKADLVVEIDYDVTEGQRTYYGSGYSSFYHYPFYSPFHHYAFRHHHHYGFGYAFYPREPYVRTIYISRLFMKIRRASGELLFEGSALSNNYREQLPQVMPYLVGAMFTNFPGQSGSTEVVRVERSSYNQS